jgi:hypothetical protein
MNTPAKAKSVAARIETLLAETDDPQYRVAKRGGCVSCDPGVCTVCGHIFTGEVYRIEHPDNGRRVFSDRAIHYLMHGIFSYETGWVVRGTPVVVDLDIDDLAAFFRL